MPFVRHDGYLPQTGRPETSKNTDPHSAETCLLETLLPGLSRVVVYVRCPRPHLCSSGTPKRSSREVIGRDCQLRFSKPTLVHPYDQVAPFQTRKPLKIAADRQDFCTFPRLGCGQVVVTLFSELQLFVSVRTGPFKATARPVENAYPRSCTGTHVPEFQSISCESLGNLQCNPCSLLCMAEAGRKSGISSKVAGEGLQSCNLEHFSMSSLAPRRSSQILMKTPKMTLAGRRWRVDIYLSA